MSTRGRLRQAGRPLISTVHKSKRKKEQPVPSPKPESPPAMPKPIVQLLPQRPRRNPTVIKLAEKKSVARAVAHNRGNSGGGSRQNNRW